MTVHTPTEFEVELPSGLYLDVTEPDPRQITVEDLATNLSKECRYGGACRGFYSVAEHAVLVASKLRKLGAPLSMQLAGLHHDDAEAVLKDVQRPAKLALQHFGDGEAYRELTRRLDFAVWMALAVTRADYSPALWSLEELHSPQLKAVDNWACAFEAARIMPSRGANWEQTWRLQEAGIPEHADDLIYGWEWRPARIAYMELHDALVSELAGAPSGVRS